MLQAVRDLRGWIEEARRSAARTVNEHLTELYWRIGERIRRDILAEERADFGRGIVSALRRQLERDYGRGFSETEGLRT